jgi:hypothetical protein
MIKIVPQNKGLKREKLTCGMICIVPQNKELKREKLR